MSIRLRINCIIACIRTRIRTRIRIRTRTRLQCSRVGSEPAPGYSNPSLHPDWLQQEKSRIAAPLGVADGLALQTPQLPNWLLWRVVRLLVPVLQKHHTMKSINNSNEVLSQFSFLFCDSMIMAHNRPLPLNNFWMATLVCCGCHIHDT